MGVAMMGISCKREAQNGTAEQQLTLAKNQLNYLTEDSIIKSETEILIDSNTAIVRIAGDTLYPRWYRKQQAAAGVSSLTSAKWGGDIGANNAVISLIGNIVQDPSRSAPSSTANTLTFSLSPIPAGKTGIVICYKNDVQYAVVNSYSYDAVANGGSINDTYTVTAGNGEYYQFEMDTYDASNNPVAIVTDYWYRYGWQSVDGYGTAYGADIKVCDIDNDGSSDLVVMTANRTSGKVNGMTYRVLKNVNTNVNSFTSTSTVINLMDGVNTSYVPRGAAIAVGSLNSDSKQDFVLVTYTSLSTIADFSWRYKVAFDINTGGAPTSYSVEQVVPGVGTDDVNSIGAALADIDGDGTTEMILAVFHNTSPYTLEYKIGRNFNATTGAFTWDATTHTYNLGTNFGTIGGGIDLATVSSNESGYLTSMFYTGYNVYGSPVAEAHLNGSTGVLSNTSHKFSYNYMNNMYDNAVGGGVGVGDLDKDGKLDVVNMAYFNERFYFYIGYGMMENGTLLQFKHGMSTSNVK